MLARHLLFIATRRHHNTLFAIDSVPPHGIVQPPPYISPPKPEECQREKIREILKDPPTPQKIQISEKRQTTTVNYGRQTAYPLYAHDPRRTLCNDNKLSVERSNDAKVCDQRQIVYMRNARNQQRYAAGKDQQFYTLPSRRPQRDVEPPRSVTPDITRGLGRGSLSTMHVLARHGQKVEQDPNVYGSQVELSRRIPENGETKDRLTHGREQQTIVDFRNRFATPLGLTALGYRFFASSPVRDPVTKSPSADALKYNPISPIGHSYGNSFKSCGRSMPTVAERLALTANNNNNNNSSMPNSGRSTPVQSSSGRSTPTNLILSPTKSTMSNEELFAAIHKSKKRLNIKDDNENHSPYGSTNSLVKTTTPTNSWNSESQRFATTISQNVQPPSPTTSRLDFKRLLLQQSVKTGPARLSAAEQLKLSRQQSQHQQQSSPNVQQTASLAKVLSPRSVWRFQTPRTDVLSSTIIEDTAAEEKAMKPSPENASPVSRLNVRQQLDLCSDLPEIDKDPVACNDRLTFPVASLGYSYTEEREPSRSSNVRQQAAITESFTANDDNNRPTNVPISSISSVSTDASPQSKISNTAVISCPPVNCSQLTPTCQQAINAFESRRISNQLARAQFLASTPTTGQERNSYAQSMFRARSESPQNPAVQNVARSPSVPTLETAL